MRVQKVSSRGVWLAPDLERTIKGERGRRGLVDPPYGYYLQLADVALRSPSGPAPSAFPITEWPALTAAKPPKARLAKPPKSSKRRTPIVPKPPKLDRPKPPRRGK